MSPLLRVFLLIFPATVGPIALSVPWLAPRPASSPDLPPAFRSQPPERAPSGARSPPPTWHEFPCRKGIIPWEAPALRKAIPSCWAELDELCVPRSLWLEWLSQPTLRPWCGKIPARWRILSPPENALDHPHTKREIERWQALREGPGIKMGGGMGGLELRALRELEWVRERCADFLAPLDRWGVLRASLLGEAPPDRPAAFLRTLGFVHLAGASGIHLYALAAICEELARLGAELLDLPVALALPLARAMSLASWFLAWCLAGARRGMLRPWLVALFRRSALALGFRWRPWAPLALALALELGVSAWGGEVWWTGRIFYALSVGGGLMVIFGSREGSREGGGEGSREGGREKAVRGRERPTRLALALGLSVGSWIFAALWEGFRGEPIALATPLLSLLTIPLFCGLAYPALLGLAVLLALGMEPPAPLRDALSLALNGVDQATAILAGLALRLPQLWFAPPWALLWGSILALIPVGTPFFRGRLPPGGQWRLGALLAGALGATRLALLTFNIWNVPACPFRGAACAGGVEQLDVGQGDAALVTGSEKAGAGMIDTGSERSLGDSGWLALFARRGIRRLSWIALTHLDEDHSGGVRRLARLIPIRCVVTSSGELRSERGVRYSRDLAGLGIETGTWSSACVPYPYYAPPVPRLPPRRASGEAESGRNQNMGAVLVPLDSGAIYLSAGDADSAEEVPIGRWARSWIARHEEGPTRRILKVSHHGSRTSSGEGFLQAIRPDQAWISVGLGNRYGLPSPSVLSRLARHGIPVMRTDRDGSIRSPRGWPRAAVRSKGGPGPRAPFDASRSSGWPRGYHAPAPGSPGPGPCPGRYPGRASRSAAGPPNGPGSCPGR